MDDNEKQLERLERRNRYSHNNFARPSDMLERIEERYELRQAYGHSSYENDSVEENVNSQKERGSFFKKIRDLFKGNT